MSSLSEGCKALLQDPSARTLSRLHFGSAPTLCGWSAHCTNRQPISCPPKSLPIVHGCNEQVAVSNMLCFPGADCTPRDVLISAVELYAWWTRMQQMPHLRYTRTTHKTSACFLLLDKKDQGSWCMCFTCFLSTTGLTQRFMTRPCERASRQETYRLLCL